MKFEHPTQVTHAIVRADEAQSPAAQDATGEPWSWDEWEASGVQHAADAVQFQADVCNALRNSVSVARST